MTPGACLVVGCWLVGMAALAWAAHTAPVIEEPVCDGWLVGIQPASIADFDESVEEDFALDAAQLRSLRFFDVGDWQ